MKPLRIPVLRVPAKASVSVRVLSSAASTFNTHWLGCKLLCPAADCPACSYDEPRDYSYLIVRELTVGKVCLFEVSTLSLIGARMMGKQGPSSARLEPFDELALSRSYRKAPVRVEWAGPKAEDRLFSDREVAAAISSLYRISAPAENEALEDWFLRIQKQARAKLRSALGQAGVTDDQAHGQTRANLN